MIFLFGQIARILKPVVALLKIKSIVEQIKIFYDAFDYADNIIIPQSFVNYIENYSSDPVGDIKTIVARAYLKNVLNPKTKLKDSMINVLVELLYYFKKTLNGDSAVNQ